MQDHSADWDAALAGSFTPIVQVDAWYDGDLVAEGLPGVSGQVVGDASRTVQTTATISASAGDDSIVPTSWGSALGCYGSLLHVRAGIQLPGGGQEMKSLGWLRTDSYSTQEQYQPYARQALVSVSGGTAASAGTGVVVDDGTVPILRGGDAGGGEPPMHPPTWVPRGSQVQLTCNDLMASVVDARFLAPETPVSLASVIAEIQRLAGEVPNLTVADLSTVTDAPIPASITYDSGRDAAIAALANVLGYRPFMNPDGALDLRPLSPSGGPVWTVSVADTAVPPVASWSRVGDRSAFYNAVVVQGTAPDGTPIVGVATEDTGPLRYGGPFGCVPYFVNNPLATTQQAADKSAKTYLQQLIDQRTVVIPVTLPANYALEVGDVVSVEIVAGDGTGATRTLTGPVQTATWPLGVGTMQVGVAVPRSDLWVA